MNVRERLERLSALMDEISDMSQKTDKLKAEQEQIKRQVLKYCRENEMDRVSASGVTVTIGERPLARVAPDKWPEFWAWAVLTSNTGVMQKRVTDVRLHDLAIEGVVLPAYVTLETTDKINVTRSTK